MTVDVQFMDKRGKHVGTTRNYKNKRLIGSVNLPAQPHVEKKNKNGMLIDDEPVIKTSNQAPCKDLSRRINIGCWHPRENTFAVAKYNSLFIYTEKRDSSSSTTQSKKKND